MAKQVFLEFEKDLGEIAKKIEALETDELESGVSHNDELARLERDMQRRTAEIYKELTPWQIAMVARHPSRPYTMDYISSIFEDFHELHGDRNFADDLSIVGGLARLAEHAVMVIGHQKGRDTRERTRRNFGMTKPEGYRKALRLMKLAEKFGLPVFTFVDTPGAYPGIDAEERNQSEAIGRNIFELSKLRVPVIATIIGEGGSGGALAIAVADSVLMLQYSTYSVISPEGCASILWKSQDKAAEAASALNLTADRLYDLKLIDKVISEPLGGGHRDPKLMASTLRKVLVDQLKAMQMLSTEELLARRLDRIMHYGRFESTQPSAYERLTGVAHEPAALPAAGDEPVVIEAQAKVKDDSVVIEAKPAAPKRAPRKRATSKTAAEPEQGDVVLVPDEATPAPKKRTNTKRTTAKRTSTAKKLATGRSTAKKSASQAQPEAEAQTEAS